MARILFEYKVICNGKTVAGFTKKLDAFWYAHTMKNLVFKNSPTHIWQVWTKGSKGNRELLIEY